MATVLTNAGRAITTNRILGGGTEPNYMAIGSGAGVAAIGDTSLFAEFTPGNWAGYARQQAAESRLTTAVPNDTVQWQATWIAGAPQTVTNGGNFDAVVGGNLFIKGDFAIGLSAGDGLQVTARLQVV